MLQLEDGLTEPGAPDGGAPDGGGADGGPRPFSGILAGGGRVLIGWHRAEMGAVVQSDQIAVDVAPSGEADLETQLHRAVEMGMERLREMQRGEA